MLRWRTYLWMLVLPFFLFSCNEQKQEAPSRYAISWFYPNNDYQHWVRTQDSSAQFIELYSQSYEDLDSILSTCNGLILTGGSDIAPDRFGALDSLAVCGKPNLRRDSVELKALEYVKRSGMPTLGVCRGMQMINVSFGGDLILDIPSTVGSHQHMQKGGDAHHVVYVTPSVRTPFGLDSAETNSNHHQAIATLGSGLQPVAWTSDSIIEAIHHTEATAFPFLWGVQWHPERMDSDAPMSNDILSSFIKAAQK